MGKESSQKVLPLEDEKMVFHVALGQEILFDSQSKIKAGQETIHKILYAGSFNQGFDDFEITQQNLSDMVKNFKARVIGTDPPVDFSHNAADKAAGWVTDLFLGSDNGGSPTDLFAKIVWTPVGADALNAKEFRYFSASFTFDFLDGSTGKRFGSTLRGGALTNIPFLRHLPPLVELSQDEKDREEVTKQKQKGEDTMADNTISLADHQSQLKVLTDHVDELKKENISLHTKVEEVKTVKAENAQLVKKISDQEAENKKLIKDRQFDDLLSKGKACEAQRQSFMDNDMSKFLDLAQPTNIKGKGASDAGNSSTEYKLSDEEELMYKTHLASHMTKEEYIKFNGLDQQKN